MRSPDFIKLDVEGGELAALQGAAGILADSRPLLLVEMKEKNPVAAGASKAAIQAYLKDYGYRAAHLRKGRWLPSTTSTTPAAAISSGTTPPSPNTGKRRGKF